MRTKENKEASVVIKDNTIIGVKFDKEATACITDVAKALLNLTEVFKAQNIHIDSLLKIENEK